MKNCRKFLFSSFIVLLSAVFFGSSFAYSENYPNYDNYVTDKANIFSFSEETALNSFITDIEKKNTVEIAVLTIRSLKGEPIENYSIQIAEKWKVGKKDKDNGLIILIAVEDKKWRIETGYGLEGILPDSRVKIIGERRFVPNFRRGDYFKGVNLALSDILGFLNNDPTIVSEYKNYSQKRKSSGDVNSFIFVMFIVFAIIKSFVNKAGGEKKKKIIAVVTVFMVTIVVYFMMSLFFSFIAFVVGLMIMLASGHGGGWFFFFPGISGRGGGWSSGGGFGGFGGGGFGGGGAGGGW